MRLTADFSALQQGEVSVAVYRRHPAMARVEKKVESVAGWVAVAVEGCLFDDCRPVQTVFFLRTVTGEHRYRDLIFRQGGC